MPLAEKMVRQWAGIERAMKSANHDPSFTAGHRSGSTKLVDPGAPSSIRALAISPIRDLPRPQRGAVVALVKPTDQGGGKRRGAFKTLPPFFWRLAPFPFAGLPIVAGDTAPYHFVAPVVAYHDERNEIAAAETNRAKACHDHELRYLTHRSVSLRQARHALELQLQDEPQTYVASVGSPRREIGRLSRFPYSSPVHSG
jgi:hypothetical protein